MYRYFVSYMVKKNKTNNFSIHNTEIRWAVPVKSMTEINQLQDELREVNGYPDGTQIIVLGIFVFGKDDINAEEGQ